MEQNKDSRNKSTPIWSTHSSTRGPRITFLIYRLFSKSFFYAYCKYGFLLYTPFTIIFSTNLLSPLFYMIKYVTLYPL